MLVQGAEGGRTYLIWQPAPSSRFAVIRISAREHKKTWVIPPLSVFSSLSFSPHRAHSESANFYISLSSHRDVFFYSRRSHFPPFITLSPRRILRLSPSPSSRREIRSAAAVINARIAASSAEFALTPRFGRKLREAFSIAGNRLPRARPSPTGS